jgi:hypothetical protein
LLAKFLKLRVPNVPELNYFAYLPRHGGQLVAHRFKDFWFSLFIPCAPPSSAGRSGDFGEDCLSAQREFRSRLTSRATQGTPQGRQTGVAYFLVTFSLAKQEKVTSCRATPGGVVLGSTRNKTCSGKSAFLPPP